MTRRRKFAGRVALAAIVASLVSYAGPPSAVAGELVTPSEVTAAPVVEGLDHLALSADDRGDFDACLDAQRTVFRTEQRGGTTVEIKEVRRVRSVIGCCVAIPGVCSSEATIEYAFSPVLWTASLEATIASTLRVDEYEQGPGGWTLVRTTSGPTSPSTVQMTWEGVGEQQVTPHVKPPNCYMLPPLCFAARVHFDRGALVDGTVTIPALGLGGAAFADAPGTMEWSTGAGT